MTPLCAQMDTFAYFGALCSLSILCDDFLVPKVLRTPWGYYLSSAGQQQYACMCIACFSLWYYGGICGEYGKGHFPLYNESQKFRNAEGEKKKKVLGMWL